MGTPVSLEEICECFRNTPDDVSQILPGITIYFKRQNQILRFPNIETVKEYFKMVTLDFDYNQMSFTIAEETYVFGGELGDWDNFINLF